MHAVIAKIQADLAQMGVQPRRVEFVTQGELVARVELDQPRVTLEFFVGRDSLAIMKREPSAVLWLEMAEMRQVFKVAEYLAGKSYLKSVATADLTAESIDQLVRE